MNRLTTLTGALTEVVAGIFERSGLPPHAALDVARSLVDADRAGIPSHGVMLLPMYVGRIRLGSVSTRTDAKIVSERGACVVLDAHDMLGQLSSGHAIRIAIGKSAALGVAAVGVRNAFHFGAAGRHAAALANAGRIGIVMSNTRPLMPAPGGAQAVVGNNPLAIAVPTTEGQPLLLDMATSASAMGKIRLAQAAGASIPAGWATDKDGVPTTDPAAAIAGMLLPAAGAKGFGLALMIDLLCGALSGGGTGAAVRPLYGDLGRAYNCAHFFLAIDPAAFGDAATFGHAASELARRIRASQPADGTQRVHCPGDIEHQRLAASAHCVELAAETFDAVLALARESGTPVPRDILKGESA